jgi:ATP-dependent helicase/DNAse subunit B
VLKNQAACPFRAFAIHRLGAREADEADVGISAAERGTVAHKALEYLWRELKTQEELLRRSREQITGLIARCVTAALDERLGRRQQSRSLDRTRELEQVRWERLLAEWLEVERRRPGFEVIESEASREVNAGGLKLQIKVDRIDQLADQTLAILDYKTSDKLSARDWEGERPEAPQLPLYAVKSQPQPSAVHFATLALGNLELTGADGAELAAMIEKWEPVVDGLGRSFLRGEAAVDPKKPPQTCEFCQLHVLCRIGQPSAGALLEGDAGE